jgi:hypothetical protein
MSATGKSRHRHPRPAPQPLARRGDPAIAQTQSADCQRIGGSRSERLGTGSIREYCLRTKERLDKAPPSAAPSCFSSFWDYMNASVRDCPLRYGPVTVYATLDGGYGYELWGTPVGQNADKRAMAQIRKSSDRSPASAPTRRRRKKHRGEVTEFQAGLLNEVKVAAIQLFKSCGVMGNDDSDCARR